MEVGSLGEIVFECSSSCLLLLQAFSVSLDARWEEHAVQGAAHCPEFLGPNLPSHNLSVLLRHDLLGYPPIRAVKKAREMLVNGEVARLVIRNIGFGRVTIRKMDYAWNSILRDGNGPLSITMNLELKEYR